jgi:hypothetical protein
MKNKKIYVLMICLAVLLTGCGLGLEKKAKVAEVKKEPVVNSVATSSEKIIQAPVDATNWLQYGSKQYEVKFLYPSNLIFYNFADGMGGAILFYDLDEYKKHKCDLIKEYHYSCPGLPMVMSLGELGFVDNQDEEQFLKANKDLFGKAEKIKINQRDAYLISGSYKELNYNHNDYVSENLLKIYIPDYRGDGSLSQLTFVMALNGKYTRDVFIKIVNSL